ncbi:metallophosphoesterase [Enterococcus sp. 2201sp1_2201st1_B8_2201SCRN_220225]|uniref:metallophosphoesterase n=1 Tax=unclassified Enterococcus TaxID=2608891 RepID=UPI0034A24869
MKPYVFAIGDVHGMYDLFSQVADYYEPKLHQLVLMGDINDRGPQVKESFLLAKKLVEEHGAVYLMGNHEELLLYFLAHPEDVGQLYEQNGGRQTIESLLHKGAWEEYSPTEIAMMIRSRYKDLVAFLAKRPLYYEWGPYVFVHAGIDLGQKDWHKTSPHDFVWIREAFYQGKNHTGKTIVFGHTITPVLHGDMMTTDLWHQDYKIGIDGGAVFGGSLHGVIFDTEGIVQDIEYQNLEGPWQPSI